MKHAKTFIIISIILSAIVLLLCSCKNKPDNPPAESEPESTTVVQSTTAQPETEETTAEISTTSITVTTTEITESETQAPETTTQAPETTEALKEHSDLFVDGITAEELIKWFAEVELDSEYSEDDGINLVQKWTQPISYTFSGTPTSKDKETVREFVEMINGVEGFPGLTYVYLESNADLVIHFYNRAKFDEKTSDLSNGDLCDGFATYSFWTDSNEIYEGNVYICNDVEDTDEKRSVIFEEMYQILGPTQDSTEREDSIIYQYSSDATELSEVDWLIFKLLYSPQIQCGMNYEECAETINKLYY